MSDVTEQYFQELVSAIGNATRGAGVVAHLARGSARGPGDGAVTGSGARWLGRSSGLDHANAGADTGAGAADATTAPAASASDVPGPVHHHHPTAAAAAPADPSTAAVALVGTHTTPAPDNGGLLYETTSLLSYGPQDVAKSEFATGTRTACHVGPSCYGDTLFPPDVLAAFGWTLMRDAALGRPPHIWIPWLTTSRQALCTVVAARTYGTVANPDHTESAIPDAALFGATYRLSRRLDSLDGGWPEVAGDDASPLPLPLPADFAPLRYAAVLFSESARNRWLPSNLTAAWRTVLFPTVGAFEGLLRHSAPAGLLVDGRLLQAAASPAGLAALARRWPAVVAPAPGALTGEVEAALAAYAQAGGVLLRLGAAPADRWDRAASRPALQAALMATLAGELGPPPLTAVVQTTPGPLLHTVVLAGPSQPRRWVVMLSDNFTACIPTAKPPPKGPVYPPTRADVALELRSPAAVGPGLPSAHNLLTGAPLEVVPSSAAGSRGLPSWRVLLGNLSQYAVVALTFPPAPGPAAP